MSALEYLAPASNPDLIGHERAESFLYKAFKARRLHHAWLISGPRGIGKATLAYRFAKYVLANLKAEANQDNLYIPQEHPIFKRVAAGGHADVLVVERSENKQGNLSSVIVAEDVRNVRDFFHMTAGEGGWRIVILDSADEMNILASNALLKILEEPPPKALFLLISHNPGRLLPTIRSRCQSLRLAPLKSPVLVDWLSTRFPDLSISDLEIIKFLAEGSIGRAIELIELDGVSIYTDILSLFERGSSIDSGSLHAFASKFATKKGSDTFSLASELIRCLLVRVIKYAARNYGADLTPREQVLFEKIVGSTSLDRWLEVWDKTDNLLASADRSNLDRKQVILNTFSCLSQASCVQ